MDEEKIKDCLQNAVADLMPDVFDKIACASVIPEERLDRNMESKKKTKILGGSLVAACLALVVVFGALRTQDNSLIVIDVNPSVELVTNQSDKVKRVEALNQDGEIILDDMDLKNVDLNVAVNALTGSMIKHGYLSVDNANVLVSVQNKDQQKADALRSVVVSDINDALANYNVTATVYNQAISDTKQDLAAFAKQNGISYGKAVFLYNLTQKIPTVTMEELASMSIQELSQMVETQKIDIRDIVYYEYDDTMTENIADTIDDINEMNYTATIADISGANYISEAKAKEIALQHAGVPAKETKFMLVKLDWDDGIPVYEVEFYHGNKEYDYEINATNGTIIGFDYDAEHHIPQTQSQISPQAPQQQKQYIGEARAKEIALQHAGVSANETQILFVKQDWDDGIPVYEVEFYQGNKEYDYTIHAIDGSIIDFDYDAEQQIPQTQPQAPAPQQNQYIGEAKAKQIALSKAGLSANNVSGMMVKFDYDDGYAVYELEFRQGATEYECDVDAVNGTVLKFEMD